MIKHICEEEKQGISTWPFHFQAYMSKLYLPIVYKQSQSYIIRLVSPDCPPPPSIYLSLSVSLSLALSLYLYLCLCLCPFRYISLSNSSAKPSLFTPVSRSYIFLNAYNYHHPQYFHISPFLLLFIP